MAKICDSCISKGAENFKDMPPVPFAAHESALARRERHNKRLWIVILVLIGALLEPIWRGLFMKTRLMIM